MLDHAYRAVAWQRVDKIRYNTLLVDFKLRAFPTNFCYEFSGFLSLIALKVCMTFSSANAIPFLLETGNHFLFNPSKLKNNRC
jgi:hypothetical protein